MKLTQETKAQLLEVIFIASLIAANVVAVKLLLIGKFIQSAGIICYPITFLVTDILSDVFGKERAKRLVWFGFIAQLWFLLMVTIGRYLPYPQFWDGQESYVRIIGFIPRLVLGSLVAYLLSQLHDVWAFHFWKGKTKGEHLWIRNNASTIVSQLIDSVVFVTIAFIGVVPGSVLLMMIIVQYVCKVIIAIVDTPFIYLGVWWLKEKKKKV